MKSRAAAASNLTQLMAQRDAIPGAQFPGSDDEILSRTLKLVAHESEHSIRRPKIIVEPAKLLPTDHLVKDLRFDLDSLSVLELSLNLEKEFHIKFTRDDWEQINTVGDVVAIVTSTVASAKNSQE